MTAFEAPGSSGFGRWRVDPLTGEVYFDPGNPGGWPVGVSTDNARAVVRDATGAIGFSALSVDVTRAAATHPLFDAALEIWRFGDQLGEATALKGAYPATLVDGDGSISLTTLAGRPAVLCAGGATSARYDLGSIGPSDALSMSASAGATVLWRARFDALGTGTSFGRIIELSNAGGGGVNGWGMWLTEAAKTLSIGVDATNDNSQVATLAGPDVYGISCAWGSPGHYYRAGTLEGTGTNAVPQPGAITRPGALLNWNHAAGRQHIGAIEWIAVWSRVLSPGEIATVSADPIGVLGLDA